MAVLVTGGAGFIGGHLAERFLEAGRDVVVLDAMHPDYDPRIKEHTPDVHRDIARDHCTADGTGSTRRRLRR